MMHTDQLRLQYWLVGSILALASVLVSFAERLGALTEVRTAVMDLLNPGRLLLLSINRHDFLQKSVKRDPLIEGRLDTMTAALKDSEVQRRQLIIENAALRQERKRHAQTLEIQGLFESERNSPGPSAVSPLTEFGVMPASILSERTDSDRLRELIIDAGKSAGISRSELVVEGSGLLIDRGRDGLVAEGDRVISGASVVGRIAKTGRWVSLVQPVTDPDFTAGIQLVRRSKEGLHFGARGILRGLGDGQCAIEGIPYTEAVSVNDDVVSSEIEGVRGPRLYFGRVSAAKFLEGGQWEVHVQPAVAVSEISTVGVVRMKLLVAEKNRSHFETTGTESAKPQSAVNSEVIP
jgi:cell shape-determining protein MreC